MPALDEATRVRRALGLLGMPAREASVYELLAVTGSKDAASIALGIGSTRGQAYRALAHLSQRGQVEVEASEPVTYRAVDPAEHADGARMVEDRRAAALAAARLAFLAAIVTAQAPVVPTFVPWKVRRVTGRHSFHNAARRLILKAQKSVLISYSPCALGVDERQRKLLLDVARRKGSEGIDLRIVSRGGSAATMPIAREAPTFLVIDGRECLFLASGSDPAASMPQGCWTSVGPLVAVAEMLHDELWQGVGH